MFLTEREFGVTKIESIIHSKSQMFFKSNYSVL